MGFQVEGTTALVTGANRGIGRAIVAGLVAAGASKVYAAVRNPASAQPVVAAGQGKVVAVELDLSRPDTIARAAAAGGDVRLVVNNAGVLQQANLLEAAAFAAIDAEIDVNVLGLLRVAHAFAPVLARNGGGAFVQLNSVASLQGFPDIATYSASKAAAYSLTQSLRAVLAGQGTQVVSVHPGPIATDMAAAAGLDDIAEPPSLVAEAILAALASGEFHAFPDSMARAFWADYEGFARSRIEVGDGSA